MKGEDFYRGLFRIINEHLMGMKFLSVVSNRDHSLTRFANSQIHQNVSEKETKITVLATEDNKIALVSSNDLTLSGMKLLREKLESMLKQAAPLEYKFSLPVPSMGYPLENVSESVLKSSAEDRAKVFDDILRSAGDDVKVFGYVSTEVYEKSVISSGGMFTYEATSSAGFNLVAIKDDGSGYVSGASSSVENLGYSEKVLRAVEFAKKSVNPVEIDPGNYTVILGPEAVAELFFYFTYVATNGYAHEMKMSPSNRYLNQKIGPDNLSVYDDPEHPGQIPWFYDIVGKKRERFPVVENGVFKNIVYSHGSSLRFSKKATGHTISLENLDFAIPVNLVINGGETPVEEMISSTEKGVYVNRFHYMNIVDPFEALLTGMTRDGTFLIEKGKLTRAIKNMRFNVKFFDFTKNIEAISNETETVSGSYFPIVAPYMKANNFTFSSKTA